MKTYRNVIRKFHPTGSVPVPPRSGRSQISSPRSPESSDLNPLIHRMVKGALKDLKTLVFRT